MPGARSQYVTESTAVHAQEPERLLTGYSGRLLLLLTVGYATMQTGRMVLSPLLPTIIEDLSISSFEAGLALSVLLWLNALMQYPSGRLSDHLSRKTIIVAAFGAALVGFALLWQTSAYLSFLLGAAVIGVATGLYPSAAFALLSDLFVERRGQAFGINTAAIDTGSALSAGLAIAVLAVASWRMSFPPVIIVLVVVLVLLHYWSREAYVFARVDLNVRAGLVELFGRPRMRWTLAAYSLYMFTWQGTAGFLPTYLATEKGLSTPVASGSFAMLFIVGVLTKPVAGALGDRLAHVTVAAGTLLIGVVGLGGIVEASSQIAVLASVVVFAVGLMGFSPPMLASLMDSFPDERMGADIGAARAVYIGIGSLGPVYVGYVADHVSYSMAFTGLVVCILGAATILVWLARAGRHARRG